ncbi:MAG: carbamate kinase [Erysipelotrichales bacterium]|nr:carbamate kinase [Erysipelotrichales bacterium]
MGRIVVALGGNALGNSPAEQVELVKNTAKTIVDLVEDGYEIAISHGNGPQVGMIQTAFEVASKSDSKIPEMHLPECGAMSQGYIGYHLVSGIRNELLKRNINKEVTCLVTEVEVSQLDEAFKNPTKPIGSFVSKEEAAELMTKTGDVYIEDAGRGYRKVVASPKPQCILERNTIDSLLTQGTIVVCVGGGGIPIIKGDEYVGVAAVIDKDLSSAKLAIDLKADKLVILTAVEKVCINFNTPNQKALDHMTTNEAYTYIDQNQFAAGSMLPKVRACIEFVEKTNNSALITSLEKAKAALNNQTGTKITL